MQDSHKYNIANHSHLQFIMRISPLDRYQTPVRFAFTAIALAAQSLVIAQTAPHPSTTVESTMSEVRVLGTAEEEARQALGTSIITAEDLARRPPANDLSELIRTMPGVNLTGNSSSGSYGNQRQIDLRGMGPENTLILIDGKPVASREGTAIRASGERDTHGDSNWVPADQIERIEVIRGPAAARYGSGAAGGVVNIITKKPDQKKLSGSVTAYASDVKDGGDTQRLGFNLSGPLGEQLAFRLYGNVAKTEAEPTSTNTSDAGTFLAAGREGTRNRDINGQLQWQLTPDQQLIFDAGFSRQGNIYSGETLTGTSYLPALLESEVRRVYRQTASVTHKAKWGELGDSRVILQYENTRTANCYKGTAGSGDGNCQAANTNTGSVSGNNPESVMENYFLQAELHTPLKLGGLNQVLTSGFEFRNQSLDDPSSVERSVLNGVTNAASYRKMEARTVAAYLEDNIAIGSSLVLTPGVRLDHSDQFGDNWSPSLNAVYELSYEWSLKGGVARAFKAPSVYQTNPYYYYQSMGNGCPTGQGPCQIQGNSDLQPELSLNKEIGVAWKTQSGWDATLSYFRNDYKNKITTTRESSVLVIDPATGYWVTQWFNSGPALVHGLEGNFNIPFLGESGQKLKMLNNFTVMFSNKDKAYQQPISIIPKYTVNSTLDWRISPQWSTQLTATFYGRQKPRTSTNTNQGGGATGAALSEVGSYAMYGVSANYEINKNNRVAFGISNLFDRKITRMSNSTGNAGAATYNEPGRAVYVSYTASF